LVTPIAARSFPSRFATRSAPVITSFVRAAISTGSCSTHPGFGMICACSIWRRATSAPAASNTMNRVLVVPWSSAPT
jgi:hypothetical protein